MQDNHDSQMIKKCGARDSSCTKNKRRKKDPSFQFYNCKMALLKGESCCSMVMCDTCMNKWVTTGSRSNDERSREEKDFDAQKAKGPNKRSSRRRVETDNSHPKATTFFPDENGCTHADRDTWQMSNHKCYFSEKWREEHRSKDPNFHLLCLTCIDCKGVLLEE